jgi:CRP-like cAMP-binding protein
MTGDGAILDRLHHWRVTTPKGRMIYDEGETPSGFYRVETGCVRLQVLREDGRRQILVFCLPGDVFGVELDTLRPMAAEAAARSELTRYPMAAIRNAGMEPGGVAGLIGAASSMVSALSTRLKGLAHASAEDRLMWFLDWLARRQNADRLGGLVHAPMSRRDVADFLGMAPETLSRTYASLERSRGILVIDAQTVQLRPSLSSLKSGLALEVGAGPK